jgi:hypothetical protein
VVEAEIFALGLGTEGGGSQWCNRLPEVVMTSVVGFVLLRGVHREESDAAVTVPELCGIPAHQAQATELKNLVRIRKG